MSCLSHHHHHQLHVHSYTITPHVPFQISHHNKHVPGGQPLSYLFHTTARPHHCLSVRITPVAAIVSIFPFPFIKEKDFVVLLLAFSTCFLFTCSTFYPYMYCYAIPSYPFSFHMLFFQNLKSRGRSSLSKGSMLGTVAYASGPRKFIPLHTLAAP